MATRRSHVLSCWRRFFSRSVDEAVKKHVVLDMVVFSYLNRPIIDVTVDGSGGLVSGAYPETGKTTLCGVKFFLGAKSVTWRIDGPKGAARNGELVENKNPVVLEQTQPGARYLAVHIYSDSTVELSTSIHFPDRTSRGEAEAASRDMQSKIQKLE